MESIKPLLISAFDLDNTLLSTNCSYRFGRFLCKKNILSFSSLAFIVGCHIRHTAGFLPIDKLHQSAFKRLFLGRSSSLVSQWADHFLDENFARLLYLPAIKKLKLAQEAGHLTIILSSAPDFLVKPIAKRLNVDLWKATCYMVDNDQKFCQINKLLLGDGKALIMDELRAKYNVAKQQTYAYSDSYLDLPFLKAAGIACGVNPDKKLSRICHENNWQII